MKETYLYWTAKGNHNGEKGFRVQFNDGTCPWYSADDFKNKFTVVGNYIPTCSEKELTPPQST